MNKEHEWRTPTQDELKQNGVKVRVPFFDSRKLNLSKDVDKIKLFKLAEKDKKNKGADIVARFEFVRWKEGKTGGNKIVGIIIYERGAATYHSTGAGKNQRRYFPVRTMEAFLPAKVKKQYKISFEYMGKK